MTVEQIIEQVQDIFREVLDNDSISVNHDSTAEHIDEWDSLTHIQLVMGIEQHFDIRFKSSEIVAFKNVGEMCEGIKLKIG